VGLPFHPHIKKKREFPTTTPPKRRRERGDPCFFTRGKVGKYEALEGKESPILYNSGDKERKEKGIPFFHARGKRRESGGRFGKKKQKHLSVFNYCGKKEGNGKSCHNHAKYMRRKKRDRTEKIKTFIQGKGRG